MAVPDVRVRAAVGAALGRVPAVRAVLIALAVGLSSIGLAVGGIWLGLRLSTAGTYPSALGSASFQVELSSRGTVEVFIPLADWGLRAHAFSAPVTLHVEPRVLNRQALIAAGAGDPALLQRTLKDLDRDGTRALERALRYMLLGVLIAAAIGWGVLRIARCRRRWLLMGLPLGVLIAGIVLSGGLLLRVRGTWNPNALDHPTYFARGAELIQLLNAAQHASAARDSYASKVQGALSGFASLLSDPTAGQLDGGRRALLISDLHDNTLVLGSLSFYAQGQPVFFVGDFGNTGDAAERRALVPRVARLGRGVVAVSGNHDSHALMLALAKRGLTVLTSHGRLLADGHYGPQTVLVQGIRVAGFNDPLEYSGSRPDNSNRIFSFAQLPDETASAAFAEWRLARWFASLLPRPDVVLIHQNRLAQYLARKLWAEGYSSPLTILTGHDHIQHVKSRRPDQRRRRREHRSRRDLRSGQRLRGARPAPLRSRPTRARRGRSDSGRTGLGRRASAADRHPRAVRGRAHRLRHGDRHVDPREGPNTAAIEGLHEVSPLAPQPSTLSGP